MAFIGLEKSDAISPAGRPLPSCLAIMTLVRAWTHMFYIYIYIYLCVRAYRYTYSPFYLAFRCVSTKEDVCISSGRALLTAALEREKRH